MRVCVCVFVCVCVYVDVLISWLVIGVYIPFSPRKRSRYYEYICARARARMCLCLCLYMDLCTWRESGGIRNGIATDITDLSKTLHAHC